MNQAIQDAFAQGIKLGPTINKDRYICPDTGAHFEFLDMCRRMKQCARNRAQQYPDLGNPLMTGSNPKRLNKELTDQTAVTAMMKKQQRDSNLNQEILSNHTKSGGLNSGATNVKDRANS